MDKGTFSNFVSAAAFGLGLVLPESPTQRFILATGMFAFSGGITNSLAVKMLFDRVPGLVGSGVIPGRFREIRRKMRELILAHFFDPAHLRSFFQNHRAEFSLGRYLKGGGSQGGIVTGFVEKQWDSMASPQVLEPLVDRQIEKLLDSSIGGLIEMVGVSTVKPAVSQFVGGLVAGLKDKVLEASRRLEENVQLEVDEERVLEDVRRTVDGLLEEKLEQLDAPRVKRMMEDVIRHHLGWLVVWGNVFGALIGLVSLLVGG